MLATAADHSSNHVNGNHGNASHGYSNPGNSNHGNSNHGNNEAAVQTIMMFNTHTKTVF